MPTSLAAMLACLNVFFPNLIKPTQLVGALVHRQATAVPPVLDAKDSHGHRIQGLPVLQVTAAEDSADTRSRP